MPTDIGPSDTFPTVGYTTDPRHTFKLLPIIGKHIVELLEDRLQPNMAHAWRWGRPGDPLKSVRAAPAKDLADMPGWKHGEETSPKL